MTSAMSGWVPVATISECPPGTAIERVVVDRIVALFNVQGTFYALDGICPHQGGPLGQGRLCGQIITCPWHGFQFDVTTGQHQATANLHQPTLPCRVDGEQVLVALEGSR